MDHIHLTLNAIEEKESVCVCNKNFKYLNTIHCSWLVELIRKGLLFTKRLCF